MLNIISYIALVATAVTTVSGLAPATTFTESRDTLEVARDARISSSSITGGFATFFQQGGFVGACGSVHSDSDLIAAISVDRYGNCNTISNLCGMNIDITNPANSKSVTVTIVDCCVTCRNSNSMDLSIAAFEQISTLDQGEISVIWSFV